MIPFPSSVIGRVLLVLGAAGLLATAPGEQLLHAQPGPVQPDSRQAPGPKTLRMPEAADPMLQALREEVQRSLSLQLPGAAAPHLVIARVVDEARREVSASLGAIIDDEATRNRQLTVEVKVGDTRLDSGNYLADGEPTVRSEEVPYESGAGQGFLALRRELWLLADASYKAGAAVLEGRRSKPKGEARPLRTWSEDPPGRSGAKGPPELAELPDSTQLRELARSVSAVFRASALDDGRVRVKVWSRTKATVASDGTSVMDQETWWLATIAALAHADDGTPIVDHRVLAGPMASLAASRDALLAAANSLIPEIEAQRQAPILGDWVGPIWFRAKAAPQLLESLLNTEISATPPAEAAAGAASEGTSWSRRISRRVLPRGVQLTDDPGASQAHGLPLIGTYQFDDEGSPAQNVALVRDGRLEHLLSGRVPSLSEPHTNGHGRASVGAPGRGKIGNLLFEVDAPQAWSSKRMQSALLAEAREEGVDGGVIIDLLDDPAATTELLPAEDTAIPDLPRPLIAYRVHADGRSEAVRVGTLVGMTVQALAHLKGLGSEYSVHSYLAPGGMISTQRRQHGDLPTTIVAPSLLLGDIELRAPLETSPQQLLLGRPPSPP